MTYKEILSKLKELDKLAKYGAKPELKELPNILFDDETIKEVISCFFDGRNWLAFCTNKRVILLSKGMIFGFKQVEIPLEEINSIKASKNMIVGTIVIYDEANTMVLENVLHEYLQPFVSAVNRGREALKQSFMHNVKVEEKKEEDFIDQLERLAVLRDKGIVTEEEFQAKKKQILGL